jgi:hypothetical protein
MSSQKLPWQMIGVTLVMLLLAGCSVPPAAPVVEAPAATSTLAPSVATPTPEPPTATPTPEPPTAIPTPGPPTATPAQAFTLAASAEEIVGTWQHLGVYYIRFNADGTFHQAEALDKLDSQPYAVCKFRFEGTQMSIEQISVSGVPTCGSRIGVYEVRLLEGGKVEIVVIKDKCSARAGDISRESEPVR